MKLSKDKVNYLIFEGGGGKGVTYIGALEALEELGILRFTEKNIGEKVVTHLAPNCLKGVAGTSVGSLFALLVSLGYNSQEIRELLKSNLTDEFLDTIEFGLIQSIYSQLTEQSFVKDPQLEISTNFVENKWSSFLQKQEKSFKDLFAYPLKMIKQANYYILSMFIKFLLYYESRKIKNEKPSNETETTFIPTLRDFVQSKTLKNAVDKILDKPADALNSLKYEFGFFLGNGVREVIDRLIEEKTGVKNCTFNQFYEILGIDLVITSFDLQTKQVEYLRKDSKWRNLCVADAVRMSISIPLVFKPVVINMKDQFILPITDDVSYAHYFIDGGAANNFPIHVFDNGKDKLNPNVLGLTLSYKRQYNPFIEEITFFEYLEDVFLSVLKQTTNLQFKKKEEQEQVIELDPEYIKVLDFSFDEIPEKTIQKAKKKTLEYFK
ncbi:MAG: patatin-like phospholipase family protein [Candidatus Heimdallarchaeaceae archaeon]